MRNPQNLICPLCFSDLGCRAKGQYSLKSGSESLFTRYLLLMDIASGDYRMGRNGSIPALAMI